LPLVADVSDYNGCARIICRIDAALLRRTVQVASLENETVDDEQGGMSVGIPDDGGDYFEVTPPSTPLGLKRIAGDT